MRELIAEATPRLPKHKVEAIGDRVWNRLQAEMEKQKDELSVRSLYGDGWSVPPLDEGDFHILMAVSALGAEGTPGTILDAVEKWTGRTLIVEPRLNRLETEGFVASSGAQSQRLYQVTEYGERALRRARMEGKQVAQAQERVADDTQLEASREELLRGGLPEKLHS